MAATARIAAAAAQTVVLMHHRISLYFSKANGSAHVHLQSAPFNGDL